jgi:hypothetical protein
MSELVTSTDWRGVPCTMRYSNPNGKPVLVGDVTAGENVIRGGQAPHKEGSTGYVNTDRGSYYVGTVNAYWDPDFEPKNWCVFVNDEPYWWVDYNEPLGYLAAHGVASFHDGYVKAVEWD